MTPSRRLLGSIVVLIVSLVAGRADDAKDPPPVKLADQEQSIFDMTNKEREKEKLPPLKLNATLTEVARKHSQNQAKQEKMEHVLDGKKPSERVTASGYEWSWVGENVAVTTGEPPAKIMELWMKSEGHRENILKDKYAEIGVGMAKSAKGDIYYTQVFGTQRPR